MEPIQQLIAQVIESWQLKAVVGMIVLNVLLGIAAALRNDKFEWGKVADFYRTKVIPYLIGYVALAFTIYAIIPPNVPYLPDTLVTIAWIALTSTLTSDIFSKLSLLYPQVAGQPTLEERRDAIKHAGPD